MVGELPRRFPCGRSNYGVNYRGAKEVRSPLDTDYSSGQNDLSQAGRWLWALRGSVASVVRCWTVSGGV